MRLWCACALLLLLVASRRSWANGAFPDSLQILLPADRPDEIALATNFGLILTEDRGGTWQWVCEGPALMSASLYQVGPSPLDRLFAVSTAGIVTSDDQACTWRVAGGMVGRVIALDVFAGPVGTDRVLGIALPFDGMVSGPPAIFESTDGGHTFDKTLYRAAAQDVLTGVEVAASDPKVIYAPMYSSPGIHPKLLRTSDGALTWETVDLEPMIGRNYVRLVGVDRKDARRIYLRVQGSPDEELAISDDGGTTLRKPVRITGRLTGFAVLPSGTIVVGGVSLEGAAEVGVAFRSRDGGETFQPLPNAPRVRAMAVRDGLLYVAADDFKDGYALAVSTDEGDTLTPIMNYADVSAVKGCLGAACGTSCLYEATLKLWPRSVCGDAGVSDVPASGVAQHAGCGCSVESRSRQGHPYGIGLIACLVLFARRRVRRA